MAFSTVRVRKYASKKKDHQGEKEPLMTFTDLFKLVCVQFGVCSVEYFMDKMKPYELSIICDSLHLRVKDSWEQSRMIAYMIAQTNSTKRLKPTDIIKFGWEKDKDKEHKTQHAKPLTLEDVDAIKARALQRQKELMEKGII